MPPQQPDRLLDVPDQLFRLGAHESLLLPVGLADLTIARRGRNSALQVTLKPLGQYHPHPLDHGIQSLNRVYYLKRQGGRIPGRITRA
jgi:hypothetical protein